MEKNIPAINIEDLSFVYRNAEDKTLKDINLTVQPGESVVIMGHNGSGKSSLCTTLNGLIPKYKRGEMDGNVFIFDENTRESTTDKLAMKVGMVFQDFECQLFSTSVVLEVAFGCENFGLPREEIGKRIDQALETTMMEGFRDRQPAKLSGGQKQRLAIASILAMQTPIVVLDEPTTDLDPMSSEQTMDVTMQLCKEAGSTVVIVTHEPEEALAAQRAILLKNGEIIADGPTKEILTDEELLQAAGVHMPEISKFFNSIGYKKPLPLTVEEGLKAINEKNIQFSPEKYAELVEKDKTKFAEYGKPIITTEDLHFQYPTVDKDVLHGINLSIREGEFVVILGQNGSGKTTLVKHFNGLLKPTSGKVFLRDMETSTESVYNLGQLVSYVFQNPDHMLFSETIGDELAFSPKLYGLSEEETKERVANALKIVGMEGQEKVDPFTLPKSGRQAVALATALASNTEVIIMDEPTTGLDYDQQIQMMDTLKRLNEQGRTIIVITHSMWVAAQYAHRVIVVQDGNIILDDTPRNVFKEEEKLRGTHLYPPTVVRLSNQLGCTILSCQELAEIIQ